MNDWLFCTSASPKTKNYGVVAIVIRRANYISQCSYVVHISEACELPLLGGGINWMVRTHGAVLRNV